MAHKVPPVADCCDSSELRTLY